MDRDTIDTLRHYAELMAHSGVSLHERIDTLESLFCDMNNIPLDEEVLSDICRIAALLPSQPVEDRSA